LEFHHVNSVPIAGMEKNKESDCRIVTNKKQKRRCRFVDNKQWETETE